MRDTKYKINSQSLLANIANVGFSAVLKGNISSVFSRLRVVTFDAVVFGLCCRPNASLSGYCPLFSSHGLQGWLTRAHSTVELMQEYWDRCIDC